MQYESLRKAVTRWFVQHQRDLPWRRTHDPYAIWISEIMLQQTRVAAVIPYYERFLSKYPRVQDLAAAPETELLAMWAGLGYYSRARNLQKAAQQIAAIGDFPREHADVLALAGIGDYTAAASPASLSDRPTPPSTAMFAESSRASPERPISRSSPKPTPCLTATIPAAGTRP
ncbi:MAG: hypothetical protein WDO18_10860 [Acidobacteriota bacterium]